MYVLKSIYIFSWAWEKWAYQFIRHCCLIFAFDTCFKGGSMPNPPEMLRQEATSHDRFFASKIAKANKIRTEFSMASQTIDLGLSDSYISGEIQWNWRNNRQKHLDAWMIWINLCLGFDTSFLELGDFFGRQIAGSSRLIGDCPSDRGFSYILCLGRFFWGLGRHHTQTWGSFDLPVQSLVTGYFATPKTFRKYLQHGEIMEKSSISGSIFKTLWLLPSRYVVVDGFVAPTFEKARKWREIFLLNSRTFSWEVPWCWFLDKLW